MFFCAVLDIIIVQNEKEEKVMKPSHRKDVIIARIIFAFICLALIGIIVGVVILITPGKKVAKESQQTESQQDDVDVPIVSDLDKNKDSQSQDSQTGDTQQSDSQSGDGQNSNKDNNDMSDGTRYVTAIEGVRLREQPSTDAPILAVCPPGDPLKFISEENGWAKVDYDGQIGYVSSEFLEEAE